MSRLRRGLRRVVCTLVKWGFCVCMLYIKLECREGRIVISCLDLQIEYKEVRALFYLPALCQDGFLPTEIDGKGVLLVYTGQWTEHMS